MSEVFALPVIFHTMIPVVCVICLVLGIWILNTTVLGRLPDHLDNNMNAAVVAGARLIAVGSIVSAAAVLGYEDGILRIAALCLSGIAVHVLVSMVLSYAYRGAVDVVQQSGPLLPCAVLVAASQVPAALISIASIILP